MACIQVDSPSSESQVQLVLPVVPPDRLAQPVPQVPQVPLVLPATSQDLAEPLVLLVFKATQVPRVRRAYRVRQCSLVPQVPQAPWEDQLEHKATWVHRDQQEVQLVPRDCEASPDQPVFWVSEGQLVPLVPLDQQV